MTPTPPTATSFTDPKLLQFNIGKSFGLTEKIGKEKLLEEYKERMTKLESSIKNLPKEFIDELTKQMTSLENELEKLYSAALSKQQKFIDSQMAIITSISKIKAGLQGNAAASQKVDDIIIANIEKLAELFNDKLQISTELVQKINDFHQNTENLFDNHKKRYETFIEKLEKEKIDFTELENGFQYGKALLLALSKV